MFHVLARFHAGDQRRAVLEAVTYLESVQKTRVERVLERFDGGRRPDIDDLKVLDKSYSESHPMQWARFQSEARECRGGVIKGNERSVVRPEEHGDFAAGESVQMDALWRNLLPTVAADNRYAGLLRCVVDRVRHVLGCIPGDHQVTVSVLSLRVFYAKLGVPGPLSPAVVGDIIGGHIHEGPTGRVRAIPGTVEHYRGDVHPMLGPADFATNGTPRQSGKRNAELGAIEKQLWAGLGACVRRSVSTPSGDVQLSFLSATGGAEEWVCWAVEKRKGILEPTPPTCPPGRRWAVEQAREWADAF